MVPVDNYEKDIWRGRWICLLYTSSAESEITAVAKGLQAAIDGLEKLGDKKALQTAINEANALDKAAYTTASFADVKTALAAAAKVNQKADATEKDVADAEKALKDAVSALVRLGDKTDLKAAIAEMCIRDST